MAALPNITPIGDITGDDGPITIKARVTNKSDIRRWENENGSGRRLFFECMDKSGEEIRCVGFNEKADELNETININGVYTITNLRATRVTEENKRRYRIPIKHDWELVLRCFSKITPSQEEENIPYRTYKLREIQELSGMVQPSEPVRVDVIGVCDSVCSPIDSSQIPDSGYMSADLYLVDDSTGWENGITLTLWGDQAHKVVDKDTPFVVVVKRARLSDYNDGTLNSGDTNMIEVDPDLPEAYELMKWFKNAQE